VQTIYAKNRQNQLCRAIAIDQQGWRNWQRKAKQLKVNEQALSCSETN